MQRPQYKFLDPRRLDGNLATRLRQLADDIERAAEGGDPPGEVLDAAPLLEEWRYMPTLQGVRLAGKVSGHPSLLGGRIVTSPLWIMDPHLKWSRTTNRHYRLGTPAGPDEGGDDRDHDELKEMLR
ncbi:DUF6634 family protein [Tardiphaga sp.]|jgi:hypothetical protein|uniref:DUF6634 family protein n=1 Tax=Tardiphaga sp. TaxID=1926292 RepID=UPI0037D9E0D8